MSNLFFVFMSIFPFEFPFLRLFFIFLFFDPLSFLSPFKLVSSLFPSCSILAFSSLALLYSPVVIFIELLLKALLNNPYGDLEFFIWESSFNASLLVQFKSGLISSAS